MILLQIIRQKLAITTTDRSKNWTFWSNSV